MKKEKVGSISHEAIYQFVYAQMFRNGWSNIRPGCQDLRPYLRRKKKRRTRRGMRRCQRIFKPKGVPIDLRPAIVEKKKRIGDWEGDSVESKDHKPGVNTLLERKTGMFLVTRLKNKSSSATASAVQKRMSKLPKKARNTLTLDNGTEWSAWEEIENATGLSCFFAHPYHSWERGANENANGLLREYFPKKTDFDTISDEQLAEVEFRLNSRPRKRLGFMTPLEAWSVALGG
jgi:IS30 family transposase